MAEDNLNQLQLQAAGVEPLYLFRGVGARHWECHVGCGDVGRYARLSWGNSWVFEQRMLGGRSSWRVPLTALYLPQGISCMYYRAAANHYVAWQHACVHTLRCAWHLLHKTEGLPFTIYVRCMLNDCHLSPLSHRRRKTKDKATCSVRQRY